MGLLLKTKGWVRKHPRIHRTCSWMNQRRKRLTIAFVFVYRCHRCFNVGECHRANENLIGSSGFDGYVIVRRNLCKQRMSCLKASRRNLIQGRKRDSSLVRKRWCFSGAVWRQVLKCSARDAPFLRGKWARDCQWIGSFSRSGRMMLAKAPLRARSVADFRRVARCF